MRGPLALGARARHHLPDRIQHVGSCAQFESAPHEARGQFELTDAGHQFLLYDGHRLFGDAACPAEARNLIWRFHQLGGADHCGGFQRWAAREQPVRRVTHRPGELVDGHGRARRDEFGHHLGQMLDTLIEFEVKRAVTMIGGHLGLGGGALAERHEQMRMLVAGQHDGHRALGVRQPGVQ